ncbi:glycosyltransferase family 4 protein [candidate division KSB1 bacterium]|nr:glycosyltransferase family 4 protein [candidate division KSB1 bacterium]NIR71683.1 glycosyltransferase family 4 protein [candidate division KSB1 bacterium]NIS26395.1 glycosyltransferase family 4 protein [candidate division KSB1 bacterium]NIT73154.1 glycosyltransferase family 4 protein [candidate division KSB1 bacterium]NIU27081.1 glycosyltransferase family 4 protein [candidate division KSB1 bacterium]
MLLLRSAIGVFGAEQMMLELVHALCKSPFEPIIGVIENRNKFCTELARTAALSGLRSQVFKCSRPFDPRTAYQIRKFIQETCIDLVHAHGYKANFYALMGTLYSKIPCMATCHPWTETDYSLKARAYSFMDRIWLRKMDAVVAVSDEVRQQLSTHNQKTKVDVIPNGIDVDRFNGLEKDFNLRRHLACSSSDLVIGAIGRLVPEKGHPFLIASAKAICEKYPHAKVLFVGDGPLRQQLERQVAELRLNSHVKFLGGRPDVPALLSVIDIFVLSSVSEGLPMVLLEAMAAAKPIVATAVGAIPKVISHHDSGLLVPPKDSQALTNAIEFFVKNQREAVRMASAARRMVLANYSSKHMAQKYLKHYEQLVS